jgi:hypothetical protein
MDQIDGGKLFRHKIGPKEIGSSWRVDTGADQDGSLVFAQIPQDGLACNGHENVRL